MTVGWLLVVIGLAALAVAFVLGGLEERIFVAAQTASAIAEHTVVRLEHDIRGAIAVDLAVLAVIVPIAMRTSKAWPLFAASLSFAALMTEAAQLLVHASPEAYAITQAAWDLLADLLVAVGAWNVWTARRRDRVLTCARPQTKTPDRD